MLILLAKVAYVYSFTKLTAIVQTCFKLLIQCTLIYGKTMMITGFWNSPTYHCIVVYDGLLNNHQC